jgi:hypothetical protein
MESGQPTASASRSPELAVGYLTLRFTADVLPRFAAQAQQAAGRLRRIGILFAGHVPARQKKLPSRGGWFRPSCELKTVYATPATSAWASGHLSGQTAGRDSSARFGVKPTGNSDAGKFAG